VLTDGLNESVADENISKVNAQLETTRVNLDPDVLAVWNQIEIARNNPFNQRYFEDVKEELNPVIFRYRKNLGGYFQL
jgi:hypothetical protein